MRMTTIWMVEDREDPSQSGFGRRRIDAQSFVSGNRGYDYYTGCEFRQCRKDGWARDAVRIRVPRAVAAVLLRACEV